MTLGERRYDSISIFLKKMANVIDVEINASIQESTFINYSSTDDLIRSMNLSFRSSDTFTDYR